MIIFDEEKRYYKCNDNKFNAYGLPLVRRAFPELFADKAVRRYSN